MVAKTLIVSISSLYEFQQLLFHAKFISHLLYSNLFKPNSYRSTFNSCNLTKTKYLMFHLLPDNIFGYFYLRLWFQNNLSSKYGLLCAFFLSSSHHFCILNIDILATIFVVIYVLKHKHLWFLYIIVWYRPYWKHPYTCRLYI